MDGAPPQPGDVSAPVATGPDQSRQAATRDDYISLKEALAIFISRGRPITERTLQRYCDKHQLEGQKLITAEGEKWFVTKQSVHRRIDELEHFEQLRASRQAATSRDASAPVAEENKGDSSADRERQATTDNVSSPVVAAQESHPTGDDLSRQAATGRDVSGPDETAQQGKAAERRERELYERMIAYLEAQREDLAKDKELLQSDKEALLRQLEAKDKQIDRFFESERDTKTLAGRLQSLMSAIWPKKEGEGGERYVPVHEAIDSGLPAEREER